MRQGSPTVLLRATALGDVPALFRIVSDAEGNLLAGTKDRTEEEFAARWREVLADSSAVLRVVLADGELVGAINVLKQDGVDSIGYWIDRAWWGLGIATRAIELMIGEVTVRPLTARVAVHNVGSLRALERNGFVEVSRGFRAETDRFVAGEVATLLLR